MKLAIRLLALPLICSLLISGCWDYTEYEQMVQVSAIGFDFDKSTREYTFTVQYIPTEKGAKATGAEGKGAAGHSVQTVHSAKAKTIYEAVTDMQQALNKRLFFGYLRVVVVGEDAAKAMMLDTIELTNRTPLIRNSANLIISPGRARDAISTVDAGMTVSSSEEVMDLIKLAESTGSAYPVTLQDFCEMLAIPGFEATAPRLLTVSKKAAIEDQGGTDRTIHYDEERIGDHKVSGVAAFNGDKLVGYLNEKESMGLGWITGRKVRAYKVSELTKEQDARKALYYRVVNVKNKIKVKITNGRPEVLVDVSLLANVRKYYSEMGSEFLDPKEIKVMEQKLEQSVRSDIQAVINKSQHELKSDIFGFGFGLFRENPQLWRSKYEKRWKNIFPNVPVKINVKAKVKNTGTNIRRLEVK